MSRTINNPTPAAALYLQSAPLYLEGIKEPDSYVYLGGLGTLNTKGIELLRTSSPTRFLTIRKKASKTVVKCRLWFKNYLFATA